MSDVRKGSMLEADIKKAKVAAVIIAVAFIALHIVVFVIPAHPRFGTVQKIATSVAGIATAIVAIAKWNNVLWAEELKWPYLLIIVLAFASAVLIGYCPTC
jgi:hypothetical protein